MRHVEKQAAKDPRIVLVEQVVGVGEPLHGWRWFIDGDWIVFEVPGRSEIVLAEMQAIAALPHVSHVSAVFRHAPHPGVYLRCKLRTRNAKRRPLRSSDHEIAQIPTPIGDPCLACGKPINRCLACGKPIDCYDNSIGGPNDYAYGM